jgi:hypothetical protein
MHHVQWSAISITIQNFEKLISDYCYDKHLEQKISDWYNDIVIMDIVILSQKYESFDYHKKIEK